MKKHFVVFLSPGTIVSEDTTLPIDSWDVKKAVEMSKNVKERYGATSYAFYFITKARNDDELDNKIVKTSGMYYLGGVVQTYAEVCAINNPDEEILRSNMKNNGYKKIIRTGGPWRWNGTQPLRSGDTVLDMSLYS